MFIRRISRALGDFVGRSEYRYSKLASCLFLLLCVPSLTYGQGAFVSGSAQGTVNGALRSLPGATVTVCAAGNANIPCAPPLAGTLFKDAALTQPLANPTTTDANGNYNFAVAAGTYTLTITTAGFTGTTQQITVTCGAGSCAATSLTVTGTVTLGNGSSFAPVTFSNHNNIFWAGPGPVPTFDQAVAACVTSCQVEISPSYTGADTSNLFTTSSGYKVANNGNGTVSFDRRGNFGSPGSPTATPLYNIIFNGRCAGQLVKQCTNMPMTGTLADSSIAATSIGWGFNLSLPTNGGMLAGGAEDLLIGNTVTVAGSNSPIAANDGEVYWSPSTVDSGIPQIMAYTGQAHNRGIGNVNVSTGYVAQPPDVTSTGRETFHYGFDAFGQTGTGVQTGYGYHNYGSWLSEVNSSFDEVDAGFTITNITEATNTVTVTTSATCNFVTGESVRIQGVGGSFTTTTQFPYNGVYTVLTPGCNGGSTFTYTDPTSGLSTVSGGTATAQGLHHLMQIRSSDNSVLFNPSLDGVGWKFITNDTNLRAQISNFGLQVVSEIAPVSDNGTFLGTGTLHFAELFVSNCTSSSGTCGGSTSGAVSIAAAATTVTVTATNLTANSNIFITENSALGTRLGVTCNTTTGRTYSVTTMTAGTSFVITASAAPTTNPACLTYFFVN